MLTHQCQDSRLKPTTAVLHRMPPRKNKQTNGALAIKKREKEKTKPRKINRIHTRIRDEFGTRLASRGVCVPRGTVSYTALRKKTKNIDTVVRGV